jgi:hypothetical protein
MQYSRMIISLILILLLLMGGCVSAQDKKFAGAAQQKLKTTSSNMKLLMAHQKNNDDEMARLAAVTLRDQVAADYAFLLAMEVTPKLQQAKTSLLSALDETHMSARSTVGMYDAIAENDYPVAIRYSDESIGHMQRGTIHMTQVNTDIQNYQ